MSSILNRCVSKRKCANWVIALQRIDCCFELGFGQVHVRVAAEAAREDAGGLDGRRLAQVGDEQQRPDRERPAPARPLRVVLGSPVISTSAKTTCQRDA
jgi:hypothetical protein